MPRPKITAPLCSLKGLRKTILYDYYTYRWFLFLVSQPTFLKEARNCPELDSEYQTIKSCRCWQAFLGLVLVFSLIMLLFKMSWFSLFFVLVTLAIEINIMAKKKESVAQISCFWVARCFPPEDLEKTTLYQIGETLGERYQTLTFVDAIFHLDKIYRFSILFVFFLVAYISYMPDWRIRQALFVIIFFAVVFFANTDYCYRRYR